MIQILVIFTVAQLVLCDLSLIVLHTNDMHARFEEVDRHLGRCKGNETSCFGGFARLHDMVKHIRTRAQAEGNSTLFLNAGDTFQGTPYYSWFKWEIVAKMVNVLGIDAMTLGNHEFDDGIKSLAAYIKHVKVPIVCSNLDRSQVPALQLPNLTPSKVLVVNGTKVGIVGYLTSTIANAGNRNLGGLKVLDEITSVQAEVHKLKNEGVKIIIALGHSGYDKDLEIARNVDDVDVVIGGHTHTFLYSSKPPDLEQPSGPYPTVITQQSGKKVLVVQAYFGTKYLGYLDMNFDNKGNLKSFNGTPILLIGIFPQDPVILHELEPYKIELEKKTNRTIGYTNVLLDNNNYKCKLSECEIGNLIADAFVDYMVKHCPAVSISIGFMNAGGIRASIDSVSNGQNGLITEGDLMIAIPWGEPVVVLNLSGKVLLEVLEHTVSSYKNTKVTHDNHFLQVSGLRVTYKLGREGGKHVTNVKVLCTKCRVPWFKPLDEEEVYGVVVSEYLAKGGEGFSMLANYTPQCVSEDGDYTIVAKYIEKYTPVNPRIEGRIEIGDGDINDIILPILACLLIAFFIICIFIDAILYPLKSIFLRPRRESNLSSLYVENFEYTKLPSSSYKNPQDI